MFDYIRCEAPLPDGFNGALQTKDFDCEMVEHVITADGRLMLTSIEYTYDVPKSERPFPDAPDGSFQALRGSVGRVTAMRDSHFHGWVNFYGSGARQPDGTVKWHEYRAKFTDGRLVTIEQVE